MSRVSIAAALAAIIGGVSGIGQVHQRDRYSPGWAKIQEHFASGGHLNACMISRKTTAKQQRTLGEVEKGHVFVIRMVYGLNDASDSESTFQALIDSVEAAIDADLTLNNTCETTQPDWGPMAGAIGLQIDIIDFRQFGTVLCHYAECRVCACETI